MYDKGRAVSLPRIARRDRLWKAESVCSPGFRVQLRMLAVDETIARGVPGDLGSGTLTRGGVS